MAPNPRSDPDTTTVLPQSGRREVVEKRLGWSEVLLFFWIGFAAVAYAYGLRAAVVWCAPIAAALGLFWLTSGGIIRGAQRWLTSLLPTMQLFVLWPSLTLAWQMGCTPTQGTAKLALIALPVVLSAMIGSRSAF